MPTAAPARGPFARWRNRFGGPRRPFPSSTDALTPDDWRVIKLALETAERDHTKNDRWPAAEAAHNVRRKLG